MRRVFSMLLFSSLSACIVEDGEIVTSKVTNETSHLIALKFYKDGVELMDSSIKPNVRGQKEVSVTSGSDGLQSYPTQLSGYEIDSLVVTFDNNRKTIHCGFNKVCQSAPTLMFESSRNFFNQENWSEKIVRETKHYFEAEYTYSFTEQDYLNAK